MAGRSLGAANPRHAHAYLLEDNARISREYAKQTGQSLSSIIDAAIISTSRGSRSLSDSKPGSSPPTRLRRSPQSEVCDARPLTSTSMPRCGGWPRPEAGSAVNPGRTTSAPAMPRRL